MLYFMKELSYKNCPYYKGTISITEIQIIKRNKLPEEL